MAAHIEKIYLDRVIGMLSDEVDHGTLLITQKKYYIAPIPTVKYNSKFVVSSYFEK